MADNETAVTAPATESTVESAALDIKKKKDETEKKKALKRTPRLE